MGHSALQEEEEEEDGQKVTFKLHMRTDRAGGNNTHQCPFASDDLSGTLDKSAV